MSDMTNLKLTMQLMGVIIQTMSMIAESRIKAERYEVFFPMQIIALLVNTLIVFY